MLFVQDKSFSKRVLGFLAGFATFHGVAFMTHHHAVFSHVSAKGHSSNLGSLNAKQDL